MAWYSYFLLSLPEAFAMIILTFALLGISFMEHRKSIIMFSILFSAFSFSGQLLISYSFKVYFLIIVFSLLVSFIFKKKLLQGALITLVAVFCILVFQITFTLISINLFSLDIEETLTNPWKGILASNGTTNIPMLLTALILYKYKLKINILYLKIR